jgi:hypothetical protein
MELQFLLRMPKFPVIISTGKRLFSARSPKGIIMVLTRESENIKDVKILLLDSTGEEFIYADEAKIIHPSFMVRRWTKMQLIELYNSSENAEASGHHYPTKSLSSKRYERVFQDIVALIEKNPPFDIII